MPSLSHSTWDPSLRCKNPSRSWLVPSLLGADSQSRSLRGSLLGLTPLCCPLNKANLSAFRLCIILGDNFKCSGLSSSVQLLSHVRLFATLWTAAHQASLSITNSQGLSKLMSIESVMPSNCLILCRPLLLLPSIFPCIRVFSSESALHIRWLKY